MTFFIGPLTIHIQRGYGNPLHGEMLSVYISYAFNVHYL